MSHAWVYCHNWSLYITDETQIWQYSYVYGWELLKLYFDYNHRYKNWLKRIQSLESQPQIVCPGPNKTVHVLVMHRGVKTEALLVLWKHRFIQFHYSFVSKKSHFVSHCDGRWLYQWASGTVAMGESQSVVWIKTLQSLCSKTQHHTSLSSPTTEEEDEEKKQTCHLNPQIFIRGCVFLWFEMHLWLWNDYNFSLVRATDLPNVNSKEFH